MVSFPCPCNGFPGRSEVNNLSANAGDTGDYLEEEMATHSSILAWKIPWREDLVGYSPRGCKESDTIEQ